MSDQDRRADGVDEDADAAAPMIVLGERGDPDVEDTTLEELRRQREELLRERAEAQERIRADRERAEAELRAERERTEQELIERQRQIDDAERDLLAAERRVRRQAERRGNSHTVPKVTRSSTPLPPRGRLRSKGTAGLLAGVVVVSGMIALVSAGTPASEEDVRGYASLAEGQLAWDEATQGLDDLIVTRMEQAGGVPSDEARAATEDAAEELITLVEEAQVVSPLPYSTALERAVTGIRAIATDQSPGAVRPVNQWREQRYSLTDGASNRRAFTDATETMTPGSPLAWWLLGIMLLALAELIRLAVKDRAYVALALLGVAGVTGVASMVYLGIYQQVGSMADSVSARDDVARDHRSTVDAQGRDLGVIFGVDRSVLGDEEHWTRIYFHDLEEIDPEVAQNYWDVRAGFADLGPEEQLARAPELVSALEPVWEQRREDLQAANAAVIAAVDHPPGVAPLLLTTLVTAGLAVGAVFVPSHRPDRLRTTAALSGNASRGGDVKRANDVSAKGEGSRDSRTARGQNAQPRNTGRNTRRNTPARGRAGRRGGRR